MPTLPVAIDCSDVYVLPRGQMGIARLWHKEAELNRQPRAGLACPWHTYDLETHHRVFECGNSTPKAAFQDRDGLVAITQMLHGMSNRTVWMIGDSLSFQHHTALRCACFHSGATLYTAHVPSDITHTLRQGFLHKPACFIASTSFLPSPRIPAAPRFCVIPSAFAKRDPLSTSIQRNLSAAPSGDGLWSREVLESLVREASPELRALVGDTQRAGVASPRDVLILNLGLFFTSDHAEAARRLRLWLAYLTYLRVWRQQLPHVLWREVTPQHFDTSDGSFDRAVVAASHSHTCQDGSVLRRDPLRANALNRRLNALVDDFNRLELRRELHDLPSELGYTGDSHSPRETQRHEGSSSRRGGAGQNWIEMLPIWEDGVDLGHEHLGAATANRYSLAHPSQDSGGSPLIAIGVDCTHFCEPSVFLQRMVARTVQVVARLFVGKGR